MTISELIDSLELIMDIHGDISCLTADPYDGTMDHVQVALGKDGTTGEYAVLVIPEGMITSDDNSNNGDLS